MGLIVRRSTDAATEPPASAVKAAWSIGLGLLPAYRGRVGRVVNKQLDQSHGTQQDGRIRRGCPGSGNRQPARAAAQSQPEYLADQTVRFGACAALFRSDRLFLADRRTEDLAGVRFSVV